MSSIWNPFDTTPPSQRPSRFGGMRKLTPKQRDEIRRRYQDGETSTSLALEFGVSIRMIKDLGGRRT